MTIEQKFTQDRLAALYDAFCPPPTERDDFAFYLPLAMSARAVLDVAGRDGRAAAPGARIRSYWTALRA